MATGYTACIEKGATFEEFAMKCAHAIGYLISLRDRYPSASIPNFVVDDYYRQQVEHAKAVVYDLKRTTLAQAEARAEQEYLHELEARERSRRDREELCGKYEAMLVQVEAWQPPTAEHASLKKFMREQVTDSINWDCSLTDWGPVVRETGREWLDRECAQAKRMLVNAEKSLAEEERAVAERNEWVKQLRESLRK